MIFIHKKEFLIPKVDFDPALQC